MNTMDAMPPIKEAAASIQASSNNAGGNARIKNAPATATVWDDCFDDPVSILQKGLRNNLHDGGVVIVSMCGDHHDSLWQAVAACCATVEERTVQNSKQVRWKIRALKPLMRNDF